MSAESTDLAQPSHPLHTMPIDVEHLGIRVALPILTVMGFILTYLLVSAAFNALNPDGTLSCLALIAALFGGIGFAAVAERILKKIWGSGRALILEGNELRFQSRKASPSTSASSPILLDRRVNLLAWRFTIKRGSAKVQKGWIMLGCQITQDDNQITVYAFVPSKEADAPRYQNFIQLVLRSVLESGELPLREANKQRRLLRAEDERWMDGSELRREDFAALIDTLLKHDPNWQELPT